MVVPRGIGLLAKTPRPGWENWVNQNVTKEEKKGPEMTEKCEELIYKQ